MITGVSDTDQPEPGILGSLPKTRPQRPSARRAAATRNGAAAVSKPKPRQKPNATPGSGPKPKRESEPKSKRRTVGVGAPRASADPRPVAPKQGFEAGGDFATGPVQPPSATEIATSFVDMFGELAQTGLAGGGRLVKDALTRLLRS